MCVELDRSKCEKSLSERQFLGPGARHKQGRMAIMKRQNTLKAVLLAASSAILLTAPAGFADETGDFAQFSASAEVSNYAVDYRPIQQFTKAFALEQRGRMKVSYAAVEQQGEAFMKTYMKYLSEVPVSTMTRDDQLAYWLNTRNMLVIDAMTDSKSRRRMSAQRGTPDNPGDLWTCLLYTSDAADE